MNTDLSSKSTEIEELSADLALRDNKIEELNTDLTSKCNEIESLSADLALKEGKIEELNTDLTSKSTEIEELKDSKCKKDEELSYHLQTIDELQSKLFISNYEKSNMISSYNDVSVYVDSLIADYNNKVELIHSLQLKIDSMNSIYDCVQSVVNMIKSASANGDYLLDAYACVIADMSEKLTECYNELYSKSYGEIEMQLQGLKIPVGGESKNKELSAQLEGQYHVENTDRETLTDDGAIYPSFDLFSKEKQILEEKIKSFESVIKEKQILEEKIKSFESVIEEKQILEEKIKSFESVIKEKQILEENADEIDTCEKTVLASSSVIDKSEVQSLKKKLKQEKRKGAECKKRYDMMVAKHQSLQTAHSKQFYLSVVSLIILSLLIQYLYFRFCSQTLESDITI